MQQPPRGGTWVGSTCVSSKSYGVQVLPSEWLQGLSIISSTLIIIVSLGWDPWEGLMGVGFCAGLLSVPKNPARFPHDRSCLDMSEADGVDGGAICKRGFIHLQFAEKLEAPEAERHLGSRILEVESPLARGSPDAATSTWWDLGR
ncbi:hypothetical protein V1477_009680 [Vespula maculifrons]|uniref:Uncharacterized protein n=1 Tax=Vespula maculifrons TaxID=7453 RepID=A0ABD2CAG9_VESMC